MKRRNFLRTVTAAGLAAAAARAQDEKKQAAREYYEIRRYRLRSGRMREVSSDYFRAALVPALNRAGLEPVGAFNIMAGDAPTIQVLIPHRSLESVTTLPARLAADGDYMKAGAAFLDAPASNPAFERLESWLLLAFEKMPRLERPTMDGADKARIFEMRRYESHSEKASRKKIEMFNEAGEVALFKRLGFRPVFFGEMIAGPRMPNLEYMVTFKNLAHRDELWNAFRTDPEWKKMSSMPEYRDPEIVSQTSLWFLTPMAFSQI